MEADRYKSFSERVIFDTRLNDDGEVSHANGVSLALTGDEEGRVALVMQGQPGAPGRAVVKVEFAPKDRVALQHLADFLDEARGQLLRLMQRQQDHDAMLKTRRGR